jgi:Ca2+/Na+ antiporter
MTDRASPCYTFCYILLLCLHSVLITYQHLLYFTLSTILYLCQVYLCYVFILILLCFIYILFLFIKRRKENIVEKTLQQNITKDFIKHNNLPPKHTTSRLYIVTLFSPKSHFITQPSQNMQINNVTTNKLYIYNPTLDTYQVQCYHILITI